MKIAKKILLYFVLVLAVLFISLTASVFLFKEKIINRFISEANKHLNTPVQVKKIDISIFDDFPSISIVLNDVYVEDSHPGLYPLLTAKRASFSLNPIEVWKGVYTIRGLTISESETNLKVNARGVPNYNILKESPTEKTTTGETLGFALRNVKLDHSVVHYKDVPANETLSFTSENLIASIASDKDVYAIEAAGQLTTTQILIDGNSFLEGKSFMIDSELHYDDAAKTILIKPSSLEIRGSSFLINGTYGWKTKNVIDLTAKGKDTDIQALLSLLPETTSSLFTKYKSKGDVYFNASLKGELGARRSPSLSIDFGFNDATFYHPDYNSRIEKASMRGSFASSALTDPAKAVLILKNISGTLNGEAFKANVNIRNFNDPEVICDFKGRVDTESLQGFYPSESLRDVKGFIDANVAIEGKLQFLKKRATAQRVSTRGSVDLENINLLYGKDRIPLRKLSGSLQFNNNDLAMSNVSGSLGKSDFLLNGFFKNIITFILFENQPIGIEADLKSNVIDLDELFALGYGDPKGGAQQEYVFSISRNVNLNFNCDVNTLRYKRFTAREIKGDLLVLNEVAVSRKLTFKTMGGDIKLSGIVDAKNKKAIDIVSSSTLNGIYLDSAFYVFKNFDQDFIEDRHLKGQVTAEISMEMTLDQHLKLFSETLIADISATIRNGELNNFEPMQQLKKYVKDDGLSRLRFSDIKNDIHIEKKTIYIPQMEVRTNVTQLRISGTHTLDQRIDYRLVTPLMKRRISEQEAVGAMEEDGAGQTKLYLKIVGTTDNYRVSYDTESVKKKIVTDLKNEVKELKDAFKNKGTQKKKEVELQKDEYFDWDEQPKN